MAVKEVEGVLVFNNKTRDEMLKRNIGKYSQWKYGLNPAIGEYYDIDYNRELKDLKDGKSLEDFTHDGKSEYSDDIDRKYFSSGNKEKDAYTARDLTPGEYNPWPAFQSGNYLSYIEHGGRTLEGFTHDGKTEYSDTIKKKYFQFGEGESYSYRPLSYSELNPWTAFQQGTYIQYIDEVFGKDEVMTHVDYVNNLLSGQFIENALRQTEVGVIKDINVAAAMQGIVTTNPNNMSGEDTTLGKIGNSMYARTLYNGAIFNSDRIRAEIRDGENYYTKAYLTPYLVNQYGNNLANVMELSDIMKIGPNETQIREDLGKDVKILDGYDGNTADLNSPQFRILNEQIKRAINIRGVDENTLHTQIIEKIDGTTIVRDKKGNDLLLPINIYTPVDGKGYVNISKEKNDWRYNINWNDVDNGDVEKSENNYLEHQNTSGGRNYGPYTIPEYNEPDNNGNRPRSNEFNEPDEFNNYLEIPENKNTLLSKTSRLFNERAIETMVGRFHTDEEDAKPYFTDTARSYFGNSHGRNLLRLDAVNNPKNDTNGYDNPYCRTWTYHHQYNQIKKLIRPFIDDEDKPYKMTDVQAINKRYRANRKGQNGNFISGSASLEKNGVLQDNGFVRISPHRTEGNEKTDSIKNCMFSIENLAWKDVNVYKNEDNISPEQVGPNGGRIMWFPPYNLDFQEGVNVEWNQNTFIGRGEKVYTYTNTERTGTLSFSLLIDHPAVINSMTYGYDGMGQEKDPEADILRFFAGCNLPEISDKPETGSTITTGQTIPNPSTKTGEIKFKIYFPNNFSGLVNRKKDRKTTDVVYDSFIGFVQPELFEDIYSQSTDGYNEAYGEDYWWQYLLVGNNTCIPSNPELFRGYEMSNEPNKGLYDKGNFMDIALPPCKNKECQIYGEPQFNETLKYKDRDGNENNLPLQYSCSDGLDFNDKTKFVTYQVDYDLRQILINNGSLIDDKSYGLNATFKYNESRKQERGEGEYTFAEVMLAMLKTSNEKYRVLYDKYKDYLLNNCGVDEQQVNKLSEIFGNDATKYTDIKFRGSADTNDLANATMLGLRRSIATKQMMSRILKGCSDIEDEQVNGDKIDKKAPLTTASDITMKLERCCDVTLKYEIAESEKLSDTANNRGTAEGRQPASGGTSGDTTEVTFEEYLDILVRNSDFIEVASKYNEKFRKDLENFFNKKRDKEYIRTLEEDYDLLFDEIENVKNFIDIDAIRLSNFISNSLNNCDSDFISVASGEYGTSTQHFKSICNKIKNSNVLDEIPDDSYLQDTYTYFFGLKPNINDYEITSIDYDTVVNMFFFPLREINYDSQGNQRPVGADADKYKISYASSRNLLLEQFQFLLLRKIIYTAGFEKYLYQAASLMKKTSDYSGIKEDMEKFFDHPATTLPSKVEKIVERFYSAYFSEIEPELKKIKKQEEADEAARNAQQIEQNRKDTEENKAVKQEEKAEQEARVAQANVSKPQRNTRYETEAEYFTKLKVEDPVLFRNLQQKFKYFNPAFHSISPEGFNARLTFLHQCTRQGQTYEMSKLNNSANGYTKTASNLAFGRMPVCVIRIGDFINTRAIINSMSISYASSNGIIWDLNQEGAGVQPMYANVSLGITLLGGQSLGAPISRLQNAISFNYYANAEVYDNRADVAEYETVDGKTGVSYKRIWTPVMENTTEDTAQNANNNTVMTQAENNTDNRKSEVKDYSSFKNQTNEESADKFAEERVFSQEMSDYVNEDVMVQRVLTLYFNISTLSINCNLNYKNENYDAKFYKYYNYRTTYYGSMTKEGVDKEMAIDLLERAIDVAVDNFIEEHTL